MKEWKEHLERREAARIERISETIWHAEYERATGKKRSVTWLDDVSEADKERYRYVARVVLREI